MTNSLSLVLVTETFPPEVNGVAMTWGYLTSNLIAQGHRLLVIRPRQNKKDTPREEPGYSEVLVKGLPIPRYPELKFGLPARRRMAEAWDTFQPDLVHIATEGLLGWSALRLAKKRNLPVTSSFHTNFHQYGKHYGFGLAQRLALGYLRAFHNRTRATFAPTDEMCRQLEQDGLHNLRLLSRGIDPLRYDPRRRDENLRESWGAKADHPVVLYVGRVAPEKNIPLAVQAFQAFQEKCPRARFVCVGDGPLRSKLEKEHPDFIFAGMRRGDDLARHYASGDIFFAPSITETFGNVITEGLASGLAVLTFDYAAGRQHIRDQENGFLVPFDDNQAFIARAAQLGENHAAWKKVRPAARLTGAALSWPQLVEQFARDLSSFAQSKPVSN